MVKVKGSEFLSESKNKLIALIDRLNNYFEYVSILGTDVNGFKYTYSKQGSSVEESMWSDRGFVANLHKNGKVMEYSFNIIESVGINTLADKIISFGKKVSKTEGRYYPLPVEEEWKMIFNDEVKKDPLAYGIDNIFSHLRELSMKAAAMGEYVFDAKTVFEWVKVSKIFLSKKKDLEQNYLWSQGYLVPMVRKDDVVKVLYTGVSGLGGMEVLENLEQKIGETVKDAESLLNADKIEPGEYDVICSPDISGLIAHEAFGHGVEMDMFVKNRAKGKYFIDKEVASPLVSMRDAAFPVRHAGSYRFDDEGNAAGNTLVIDRGILKQGISDQLSASFLRKPKTGNGRRQSYLNKVYARMTNTYFESGSESVDNMIKSVKKGYLIDYTQSGMEDPKNWGLQGVAFLGKEILDGKLTGKVVSPIIMTGYVPDILKSISMVSKDVEFSGTGYCGKGWKEFVKVSSGGPYIKTRIRLG